MSNKMDVPMVAVAVGLALLVINLVVVYSCVDQDASRARDFVLQCAKARPLRDCVGDCERLLASAGCLDHERKK